MTRVARLAQWLRHTVICRLDADAFTTRAASTDPLKPYRLVEKCQCGWESTGINGAQSPGLKFSRGQAKPAASVRRFGRRTG